MLESFKTIHTPATAEIIEKKSRFIGHAAPVDTEAAALAFIESIRHEHARANHNCFAYQVGDTNQHQRQSDDGEPSGTAGMPIFEILRGENLQYTAVVVTRYFGGTLLGKGGLHRAYSSAAKAALKQARIIEKTLYQRLSLRLPYHLSGKMQHELTQRGYAIENIEYTDNVNFIILAANLRRIEIGTLLSSITSGQGEIELMAKLYCAEIDGKLIVFEITEKE